MASTTIANEPASPKNDASAADNDMADLEPTTSIKLDSMDNVPKSTTVSSFGLHRYYSSVSLAPDKCLLPDELLKRSPSRVDGVDEELERELRFLGCELIQVCRLHLTPNRTSMFSPLQSCSSCLKSLRPRHKCCSNGTSTRNRSFATTTRCVPRCFELKVDPLCSTSPWPAS